MKGYLFGLGAILVGGDRQGGSRTRRRAGKCKHGFPNSI
jgi:hypothetical protein